MQFELGQHVVWTYRTQCPPSKTYLVDAQVVQAGPLRVRIRIQDTRGQILFRWVKPDRLRHRQPDEPVRLYLAQPAGISAE